MDYRPLRSADEYRDLSVIAAGKAVGGVAISEDDRVCAVLYLDMRTQLLFKTLYQAGSFVFFVMALTLLGIAGYWLTQGDTQKAEAIIAGAGGLLTGAGAVWVSTKTSDASKAFDGAVKAYTDAGCRRP